MERGRRKNKVIDFQVLCINANTVFELITKVSKTLWGADLRSFLFRKDRFETFSFFPHLSSLSQLQNSKSISRVPKERQFSSMASLPLNSRSGKTISVKSTFLKKLNMRNFARERWRKKLSRVLYLQ